MKLITTALSIILTLSSIAQSTSFKKVLNEKAIAQKLNATSKNTKTIDSDFKQYKHLDILENDIESTGHFSFQASDKVRWEYFKPYKYLIIMNAGIMWINDGNKTQKFDTGSNKMFKEINDLMVGMLQGKILESKNFKISFFENSKQILAKLIPLSAEMKEFLSEINLYFDKKDYSVSKIKMLEHSGDYTLIEFFNRKTNIDIPKSKFLVR
ncbi:MAG: outer membrane lipoprotein carrier protein LolA [Bacteroidales bacterium]|nr:outer membrane lipoprotein carrier protein LolA [Bacteroidales bacterium]